MQFQHLQPTVFISHTRKYTAAVFKCAVIPLKILSCSSWENGPAVRITDLEFKLETAQHLFFHWNRGKQAAWQNKAWFSFNRDRGRQKRENIYFPWKQLLILSFKRCHWSLLIGFLQGTARMHSWCRHEGIWQFHLPSCSFHMKESDCPTHPEPSSDADPMLFPHHDTHWD